MYSNRDQLVCTIKNMEININSAKMPIYIFINKFVSTSL